MDPSQLINDQGLAIAALILVSGALALVARTLYKELVSRATRAEGLTDSANSLNDSLAENFRTALEELRKRP